MNKNLENICRVCLNNGSRNIFEKTSASNDSQFAIPAIGENVSSLDRLVEKLRYVTMLKVSEKLHISYIVRHTQSHSVEKGSALSFFLTSLLWSMKKATTTTTYSIEDTKLDQGFSVYVCVYVLNG